METNYRNIHNLPIIFIIKEMIIRNQVINLNYSW